MLNQEDNNFRSGPHPDYDPNLLEAQPCNVLQPMSQLPQVKSMSNSPHWPFTFPRNYNALCVCNVCCQPRYFSNHHATILFCNQFIKPCR